MAVTLGPRASWKGLVIYLAGLVICLVLFLAVVGMVNQPARTAANKGFGERS
jgi:hypothetical protein